MDKVTYRRIRDLFPKLMLLTRDGKIKWEAQRSDDDYAFSINEKKIEIEIRFKGKKIKTTRIDNEKIFVALFLWDNESNIIDSEYISDDDPEYQSYFDFVKYLGTREDKISEIIKDINEQLDKI